MTGECLMIDPLPKTGTASAGSTSADKGAEDIGVLGCIGVFELGVLGTLSLKIGVFRTESLESGVLGTGVLGTGVSAVVLFVFRLGNRDDEDCCCCEVEEALKVGIRRSETVRRIGFGEGGGEAGAVFRRALDFDKSGVFVDVGIFDGELARRKRCVPGVEPAVVLDGVVVVVGW